MEIMPNKLFRAREILFREGDKPDGVYYVCNGKVQISRKISGKDVIVADLDEGSVFGELAMVDDRPRSATVAAVEDTWVYHFTPESFEKKLKGMDPFMYSVFVSLVLTVRNLNLREDQLHLKTSGNAPSEE